MTRASRYRYWIILLGLVVDMVSYMDRVSISVAAPGIRDEFGLSPTEMGVVFGTFSFAYALFQTPWGAAADRFGARGIVTVAILWWSLFTAATGAVWSLASLLVVRFLFGVGEAALSPSIGSAFARWIPVTERSTAFGAFISGGRIGGAITPPIAAFLVLQYGWRASFYVFAIAGVAWAAVWWATYRNHPSEHPRVNQAELEAIARGTEIAVETAPSRWWTPLRSRAMWLLLAVAFGYTFMWQFYITWFPTYLMEDRGFTLGEAGRYAGLPFLFGLMANWVGGLATDFFARRWSVHRARLLLGFVALLGSAACLTVGIFTRDPVAAAWIIAFAPGLGDMALGAYWATAVTIGGSAAGAASGLMNSASNFGGFVSPVLMGRVYQVAKVWNSVLFVGVGMNVLAALAWFGTLRSLRKTS
ncbi:MAG: MFS transporter [Bryobacterales bacterium]|nr:MFS transporter [Bryobacterales bacterium]